MPGETKPTVTQIASMRSRLRLQEQRRPSHALALGCSGLFGLLLALACVYIAVAYTDVTSGLPSVEALPALLDPPSGLLLQPTQLYDRSGQHLLLSLENPAAAGWQYLGFASSANSEAVLPANMITATLAAADPDFWSHSGYSLFGVLLGSHPTLAQRLAADFLLQDEPPSLRRNLRERLLAVQITARFGRQRVLEWYLNSANYGHLAHGADAAARVYFGKPASQLNLAEAALLAATAQNPDLNPFDNPQAALQHQKDLVQTMLRHRMVTPQQGVQAAKEALVIQRPSTAGLEPDSAPAFTRLALSQLETQIPRSALERGGLHVLTTLDFDLQAQVACAAADQMQRLQTPAAKNTLTGAQQTPSNTVTPGCEASRLLPTITLPGTQPFNGLSAEVVVLDPLTGQVLALLGPTSASPDSHALPAHPAGSLSTPFIYLSAFTRGLSPASLVWDVPPVENQKAATANGQASETGLQTRQAATQASPTTPQNFDGAYHGPLRLRMALANDYQVPANKVLAQVGSENVLRLASQLGLEFPEPAIEDNQVLQPTSLSLLRKVNLLEISRAFGIFADQGQLAGRALQDIQGLETAPQKASTPGRPAPTQTPRLAPLEPVTILKVEDTAGKSRLDWSSAQTRPILSPQLAYLMTNVLSDETARWPSLGHPNPLEIGRPAAAKSSRDSAGDSYWTTGYTPQRVVSVWLGLKEAGSAVSGQSVSLLQAATAGLWHALAQYAHRDLPYQDWTEPGGMSHLQVCDPSGLLPTEDCPNVVDEVFLAGSEPNQLDTIYRSLPVNRETGRLATVFTPPDLVENQSFFLVPPEAGSWVEKSRLEIPPTDYDTLPESRLAFSETQITSPAIFRVVRGQVPIYGTAAGEKFVSYRIEVGQGLDPQDWFLVGQDISHTKQGGQLALWDTTGLSGLYAVQLLVARQDQSLERATTLVTVDNQPPNLNIIYPSQGEEIQPNNDHVVVLQASVDDDLGLQSVAFYLDEKLFTTLPQPPFAISWTATPGSHTLRVVATDQAGNTSEETVTFHVK